ACVKVICCVPEDRLQALKSNRLPRLFDTLHDIEGGDVHSAGRSVGMKVFQSDKEGFYYFAVSKLTPGREGYLAMDALVPLLVAADRGLFGLNTADFDRMLTYITKYNADGHSGVVAPDEQTRRELRYMSSYDKHPHNTDESESGSEPEYTSDRSDEQTSENCETSSEQSGGGKPQSGDSQAGREVPPKKSSVGGEPPAKKRR
ncbi:hypothetical protein FOZ62_003353, partial [Perkinsus olseni]